MRTVLIFPLALLLATTACNNGSSTTATTSPSQTIVTDVLLGTVPTPVGGVLQSDTKPFTVGQGGGTVTITLTSANETLPGGTLLTTVVVGLGVGTLSGTTCTLLSPATPVAAGASSSLSGTLAAGSYCTVVSDVTGQVGPVAYAVTVAHP
jgi:hypothetical protein